jgi:hypothetical protein
MISHLVTKSRKASQASGRFRCAREERAWGIVQHVDVVGRDLAVLLQTGVEIFDIPPDCPILLHGERIKLRMVQPRDHVWVTFHRTPQRAIAEKIEV